MKVSWSRHPQSRGRRAGRVGGRQGSRRAKSASWSSCLRAGGLSEALCQAHGRRGWRQPALRRRRHVILHADGKGKAGESTLEGSPRVREGPLWQAPAIAGGRGVCPRRAQEPVATGGAADILLCAIASGRAPALDVHGLQLGCEPYRDVGTCFRRSRLAWEWVFLSHCLSGGCTCALSLS